jgi:ABC-type glycerol-3-phosphate transport system permease component
MPPTPPHVVLVAADDMGYCSIGRLYWNSIYVSTVSMGVTVAISALAGYGLGRIRFAGRGVVYGVVLVGLTIPPTWRSSSSCRTGTSFSSR